MDPQLTIGVTTDSSAEVNDQAATKDEDAGARKSLNRLRYAGPASNSGTPRMATRIYPGATSEPTATRLRPFEASRVT
jgi:hypothetical protein